MAVGAGSYSDWQAVFSDFQASTGLLQNATYSLPRATNPRLAGGMTWSGAEYVAFLKAIYNRSFLSQSSHDAMFSDQILELPIESSPIDDLNEEWHYGYGVWLECRNSVFNCTEIEYYSSPGAYGAYPFINFNKNFFGMISMQDTLDSNIKGYDLFRAVQQLSEDWAECN